MDPVRQLLSGYYLQAALREHDLILTVSPGYALEICSDAAMACGMQDVLQRRGVR